MFIISTTPFPHAPRSALVVSPGLVIYEPTKPSDIVVVGVELVFVFIQ